MPIYRMTVRWTFPIGSQGGTSTWHVRTTSAPVGGTPSIATAIKNFYTGISGILQSTTTLNWDGTLAQVDAAEPAVVQASAGWTVSGANTGGSYGPAGVGMVVGWRSGIATKSGRGRTFLAPLTAAVLSGDGTPQDANVTQVRTAANALVSASLADGNGAVSIWSPTQRIGRDVQSAQVRDHVAWLSTRRG